MRLSDAARKHMAAYGLDQKQWGPEALWDATQQKRGAQDLDWPWGEGGWYELRAKEFGRDYGTEPFTLVALCRVRGEDVEVLSAHLAPTREVGGVRRPGDKLKALANSPKFGIGLQVGTQTARCVVAESVIARGPNDAIECLEDRPGVLEDFRYSQDGEFLRVLFAYAVDAQAIRDAVGL